MPVLYEVAGADGDDYARLGAEEAELYAHAHDTDEAERALSLRAPDHAAYVMRNVGRMSLRGAETGFEVVRRNALRIGRLNLGTPALGPKPKYDTN